MHRSIIAVAAVGAAVLTSLPAAGALAAGPGAPVMAAVHRTAPSWPVFQRGDQSEGVRSLQYLLRGYGITPGTAAPGSTIPTSGNFDEATEKAVDVFQRRYGLPETGKVDEAVWNSISRDITAEPIGLGYDNTEFVKAAQNMVNRFTAKCGNSPLTVDGRFGPRTYLAVTKVQECQGLEDDGVVGPRTFHTLVANY